MVHPSQDWIIDGGYLPHWLLRLLTRLLLKWRQTGPYKTLQERTNEKIEFVEKRISQPIAIETNAANEQQYEVDTGVFAAFLGPNMKYSCSLFSTGAKTLANAEIAMLQEYINRAELKNGMNILDLGCGWGSAVLYFAEMLPASKIIGFSNSRTQREYIENEATRRHLNNIDVITGDIANYEFEHEQFDRVISVELFEHMKNYELLMAKLARALKPGGKLFVHILCHRDTSYDFNEGWMARYFFTGGTMPSADLLLYFQKHLHLQKQWWVNGMNYSRTLHEWYLRLVRNRKQVWPHFVETYGHSNALLWYNRWIVYHLSLTEFFANGGGEIQGVSHYLFEKPIQGTT